MTKSVSAKQVASRIRMIATHVARRGGPLSGSDASRLRFTAKLLQGGKVQLARDYMASQDTMCRDYLPQSFFSLLQAEGVEW